MLINHLYLFHKQKPDISISAQRYGLVCFLSFPPHLCVYYVRAPQVDMMRDSSCVKTFCVVFGALRRVVSLFLTYERRGGFGCIPHTDVHPFCVHAYSGTQEMLQHIPGRLQPRQTVYHRTYCTCRWKDVSLNQTLHLLCWWCLLVSFPLAASSAVWSRNGGQGASSPNYEAPLHSLVCVCSS